MPCDTESSRKTRSPDTPVAKTTLVIACGALAHEITALQRLGNWQHIAVQCLPAELHNRPDKIPEAVRAKIQAGRDRFAHLFVAYADCGTGGLLDKVLREEGVERLPGDHCYGFFAGQNAFDAISEAELGTFYLTDFLARHFDRLIWRGMGLEAHPELLPMMFGNYTRLLYLAQKPTDDLQHRAQQAADKLGLRYEFKQTGYGELATELTSVAEKTITWRNL
ncbi:MAG: DUF1638 domain-containing protein [Pseudomonadota bacterium]